MTVLLVEDDADLAEMYQLQLRSGGHRVKIATHAQEALDVLDHTKIELILMDMMLPVHNGLSILYELRSYDDWRDIPVIILSSVTPRECGISTDMLRQLGVNDYLDKARTKPAQLLSSVNSLV